MYQKKKKGFLRLIFSRVGLIDLLIIIQISVLLSVYRFFMEYFKWLAIFQAVFSVIMIFYLFNNSMDATAKLTWLFLIMLFPIPATIMLWYTQKNIGHRMVQRRSEELIEATRGMLIQDEDVINDIDVISSGTAGLCIYLNRSGCFPVYGNTEVTFFPLGEGQFAIRFAACSYKTDCFAILTGTGLEPSTCQRVTHRPKGSGFSLRFINSPPCSKN